MQSIKLSHCEHARGDGEAEECDRSKVVDEVIEKREKDGCRQDPMNRFG
jgi:hypothetical protein